MTVFEGPLQEGVGGAHGRGREGKACGRESTTRGCEGHWSETQGTRHGTCARMPAAPFPWGVALHNSVWVTRGKHTCARCQHCPVSVRGCGTGDAARDYLRHPAGTRTPLLLLTTFPTFYAMRMRNHRIITETVAEGLKLYEKPPHHRSARGSRR